MNLHERGWRWIFIHINSPFLAISSTFVQINPPSSSYGHIALYLTSYVYTSCAARNTCVFPDSRLAAEAVAGMVNSALQLRPELPIYVTNYYQYLTRRTWRHLAPGAVNTLVHIHARWYRKLCRMQAFSYSDTQLFASQTKENPPLWNMKSPISNRRQDWTKRTQRHRGLNHERTTRN